MPPGRPTNTPKSVIDLIMPLHAVALLVVHRELVPRVRHALLHAERDAAALLVDLEDHHLDLVAELHDLGRVDVLVRPVHFRDVDQALDARLDLDERAVVGDVGDLAEQARALRVAARQADPRVLAELLHAERDAVLLLVELQDLGGHFVADREHFRRMLDAAPREVGDVQQTVDAAQVDERAVVGDVLDDALDDRAFRTASTSSFSRSSPRLSSSTARRETTTLLRLRSSLMTLKSSCLFSNGDVSLTGRMSTSEPGRNARMPLIITVRPPFTLLVTRPCDDRRPAPSRLRGRARP